MFSISQRPELDVSSQIYYTYTAARPLSDADQNKGPLVLQSFVPVQCQVTLLRKVVQLEKHRIGDPSPLVFKVIVTKSYTCGW